MDKITGSVGNIVGSITDIFSLVPDSILFGAGLLYFLTQNVTYMVFAVFILETIMSHRLIAWFFEGSVGPSSRLPGENVQCRAGYKVPQFKYMRMFMHDPYPSYGIFSITAIGTYLGLATSEFADTMMEMNKSPQTDWAARPYVAYTFIAVFILAFIALRMSKCDGNGNEVLIAAFLAIIVGWALYRLNVSIFGKEGVNFLGLPYLVSKSDDGTPIYTCAPASI